MRVTAVCLLTLALVASTMARGGQNDEKCPASPSAQTCAKSACKCATKSVAAASCPESSPNCPCETLTKAVAVAKAKCCAEKNAVAGCDAAKSKCCSETKVAQACAAGQCCKKTEVAVAAGECEDCPLFKKVATACSESLCCKQAAAAVASCEGAKCCAEKCGAKVAACESGSCDDASECCVGGETVCAGEDSCCTSEKVAHLLEAAGHLEAAGMIAEACELRANVQEIRCELLAEKTAQMERLQAEVDVLRHVAGRQVKVRMQVVKVPVNQIRKLGIDLNALGLNCPSEDDPGVPRAQACSPEAQPILEALHKAKVVDMLAPPAITLAEGHFGTVIIGAANACDNESCEQAKESVEHKSACSAGNRLDVKPVLLGNGLMCLHVHSPVSVPVPSTACGARDTTLETRSVAAAIYMQLGQTLAVTGPMERAATCCDSAKSKDSVAHHDVQTIYLITPEVVQGESPVRHTARPPMPQPPVR